MSPPAFDVMFGVLAHVACRKASRERRAVAMERDVVSLVWTVRPAAEATAAGYERLEVASPEDDEMGVCKRFYGNRGAAPKQLAAADPRNFEGAKSASTAQAARGVADFPPAKSASTVPGPARQAGFNFGD